MIGKYGISTVFMFETFWTVEIFPTTLRSSLMGIASLAARIGSALAPVIVDLVRPLVSI